MTAAKQDGPKPEVIDLPAEPPKPEVMGIERDNKNARVSFTKDNECMIITVPIAHMSRTLVRGFFLDAQDMAMMWFAERAAIKQKLSLDTRDAASRFNFKDGINKLLRR